MAISHFLTYCLHQLDFVNSVMIIRYITIDKIAFAFSVKLILEVF
jgi:hypothetical protein